MSYNNNCNNDVYMTRHSARADKARNWKPLSGFSRVDTECSVQGDQASQELATFLSQTQLSHIVSSPFYRCIQTVAPIAKCLGIKIKVEIGICEILSTFPPGFQETSQLAQMFGDNIIDLDYQPILQRNQLSPESSDSTAAERAGNVAQKVRESLDGPILFCGHGASCLGIGQAFGGSGYVGYTSISHFAFHDNHWSVMKMGDVSHLSEKIRNESLNSAW